ncbi:MAG: hypothetical protein KatS3mg076_0888 [Candidatus Binatia bacterium]|nr:MAG: hypothetical protein KatS3mg076_0888 [Candidatus Binatia bacterium]
MPLLLVLTPPGAIEFAGLLLVLASLRLGRSVRGLRWTALAAFLGLSPWVVKPDFLPDAVTEWPKTLGFYDARRVPAVFTRWHPIYRVDVVRVFEDRYFINHDGAMASALYPFSGDLSELRRFETDSRSYPFAILGPGAKVLVVGAAGGQEILASLYFGASEVTAVEVNPVTVSLLTDHFADYTGHLAEHPRVRLVNAEGRAFVSASREKWDLVWFVAPDSYTAVNAATSSAFVLTESYLYTVEMIEESLRHLTDRGIVCAQFGDAMYDKKPNRTARYVSTAREAFRRLGVEDFEKHVLVATSPDFWGLSTILLKRRPFTRAEVEAFLEHASKLPGNRARLAPGHDLDSGPVRLVASLSREELESFLRRHPYRLDPVYDDAPFFWHFARFLDAFEDTPLRRAQLDWEDGLGERVLVVLAGVSAVFAVLVLSVPVLAVRSEWKRRPRKLAVAVYFGGLGLGFMFVEVCLIQQFTLLLGFPTYSLTVTLATLLVSAGLGSLSSGFWGTKFRFLVVSWCLLAFWVALLAYGLPATTGSLLSLPMWVRVPTVVLAVLPLGLVMGGFLPFGLRRIAEVDPHPEAYVAWAWAVNAFASVVGSVVATILAMGFGFSKVRWAALGVYALGILAFRPFVRGIR